MEIQRFVVNLTKHGRILYVLSTEQNQHLFHRSHNKELITSPIDRTFLCNKYYADLVFFKNILQSIIIQTN
jgi:hypothetical protein